MNIAKNEGVSQRLHFVFLRQVKVKLNGESFYTDEELSKKLKISRSSLQDYRDQGRIPYIKLAGKILYRASDIEKLLEDN
ncbi:hypothetical protein JCM30204_12050 [Dysgonomonas termitidis]